MEMFRNILIALTLLYSSSAYSSEPKFTRSTPNMFGGQNFYSSKGYEGRTYQTRTGFNYYDKSGLSVRATKGVTGTRYQNFRK